MSRRIGVLALAGALVAMLLVGAPPAQATTNVQPPRQPQPVLPAIPPPVQAAGTINTVAGGWGHGPAVDISQQPSRLAFGNGKLFVADWEANVIRRVDRSTGVETRIAGEHPTAMVADAAGNLYLSEGSRVRKITTDGLLHTVAGSLDQGYAGDGGPATDALLTSAGALALGTDGSLYLADHLRVRKIDPGGIITTVAGNGFALPVGFGEGGPATEASFQPTALAVDGTGRIYIGDSTSQTVHRVAANGIITTIAGNGQTDGLGDGLPATQASLGFFQALALDGTGRLFLSAIGGNVRTVGGDGIMHLYAGTGPAGTLGDGGPALTSSIRSPVDLVTDPTGALYVADDYDLRVRRIDAAGAHVITTVAGNGHRYSGGDGGQAVDAEVVGGMTSDRHGGFYVTDGDIFAVRHVASSGVITRVAGGNGYGSGPDGDGGPALDAHLGFIGGLTTDAAGNLYLSQPDAHTVRKVDTGGTITTIAGTGITGVSGDGGPATAARLAAPGSLVIDADGNLVISDGAAFLVRSVTPGGTISTIAGNGQAGEWGDGGPATSAAVFGGMLLALPDGGLLITSRARIREITGDGLIQAYAGIDDPTEVPDGGFADDGGLGLGTSIALAPQGDLYFTGSNNRIRVIAPDGRVSTISGGNPSPGLSGDGGPAALASLNVPGGLLLDDRADLLFADGTRIRRIMAGPPLTPRDLTAESGHGLVRLRWTRPSFDGGASITGYTVSATPGSHTCTPIALGDQHFECTVGGLTPGTSYALTVVANNSLGASAPASVTEAPASGSGYHPVAPFRVLDSRTGTGGFTTPWGGGQTRHLKVTGVGGPAPAPSVPSTGVSSVVLNVTVTDTSTAGFLTLSPTGAPTPIASNLNWSQGQTIPNLVTVSVGSGGQVDLFNEVGSANVIADVVGWYDDGSNMADLYTPLSPSRLLDSRDGTGGYATPWAPNQVRSLQVLGVGGVPAQEATAVVVNLTVTDTTSDGFLTAYPTGAATVPNASNLNWSRGDTIANLVTVAVGTGGKINLFNKAGTTNVIADVVGYYGAFGSAFHPLAPVRLLDSRAGTGLFGAWQAREIRDLDVTDTYLSGVPEDGVTAVVMNVTVTDTSTFGFLTLFPATGSAPPNASNLNWPRGATIPNLTITRLSPTGSDNVSIYNAAPGPVHVIADVVGWFG